MTTERRGPADGNERRCRSGKRGTTAPADGYIVLACTLAHAMGLLTAAHGQQRLGRYYAHEARTDRHGVIAPWYEGQNGQLDLRVRIAAETLKRYPWTATDEAPSPAPHYVYNGSWQIAEDGTITIR